MRSSLVTTKSATTGILLFGIVVITIIASQGPTRMREPAVDGGDEMKNRPTSPKELFERIRRLRDSGLYFEGRLPEDASGAEEYSNQIFQRMTESEENISGSVAAGKLYIYVVRAPDKWNHKTNETDRYLDDFSGWEWIALFGDVLKCPMALDRSSPLGEHIADSSDRYKIQFQSAIPQYQMLSRMWNTYSDVIYQPQQVGSFRDECLSTRAITSDGMALAGLGKLIQACDEALRSGSGLYLASD